MVIGAGAKGRSSAPALRSTLRAIAAQALASDVLLHLVYIPSEGNPADPNSRRVRSRLPPGKRVKIRSAKSRIGTRSDRGFAKKLDAAARRGCATAWGWDGSSIISWLSRSGGWAAFVKQFDAYWIVDARCEGTGHVAWELWRSPSGKLWSMTLLPKLSYDKPLERLGAAPSFAGLPRSAPTAKVPIMARAFR